MTVKPGWETPMNRQYLEYIPEIGASAANSHHGQQHPLHEQPGCKAANPSSHHDAKACSPWADHVGDSGELPASHVARPRVASASSALKRS